MRRRVSAVSENICFVTCVMKWKVTVIYISELALVFGDKLGKFVGNKIFCFSILLTAMYLILDMAYI